MTDELEQLRRIDPAEPHKIADAVAMDGDELYRLLEADAGPQRGNGLTFLDRRVRPGRIPYIAAGLAVAASVVAIAMMGADTVVDDQVVTDQAQDQSATTGSTQQPLLEVDGEDLNNGGADDDEDGDPGRFLSTQTDPPDDSQPATDEGEASEPSTGTTTADPATAAEQPDEGDPVDAEPVRDDQLETASGFNPATDLLVLHHDHAPTKDDALATVAAVEMTSSFGLQPLVVNGTYAAQNQDEYDPGSVNVMDAAWGVGNWIDAHGDRQQAIEQTSSRWLQTILDGGDVWVSEGGQSDFTAAVLREIETQQPNLDTLARVHVVQHSASNEGHTSPADLDYVKSTTDYILIDDGNRPNGTANLRMKSRRFRDAALSGANAAAWEAAFVFFDDRTIVDFSDSVLALYILGIGTDEVGDVNDFATYFLD